MGRSFNVPLPESISLDLEEVTLVFNALDLAEDPSASKSERSAAARNAITLLSRKLWPELGDILDEEL